jgi:DNA invertase Pin-like site-specific DNA recombinase
MGEHDYIIVARKRRLYRRVLDWQLDLLDHTQLHTITVYTLYDSQQLSFFSCSEDPGSNSATTA